MKEYIKIQRSVDPECTLPEDPGTYVWHYMDMWKFHSLLGNRALYLCRRDRFQDRFEGTYSREQILDMEDWLRKEGHPEIVQTEMEYREQDRRRSYLSCWCIRNKNGTVLIIAGFLR